MGCEVLWKSIKSSTLCPKVQNWSLSLPRSAWVRLNRPFTGLKDFNHACSNDILLIGLWVWRIRSVATWRIERTSYFSINYCIFSYITIFVEICLCEVLSRWPTRDRVIFCFYVIGQWDAWPQEHEPQQDRFHSFKLFQFWVWRKQTLFIFQFRTFEFQ